MSKVMYVEVCYPGVFMSETSVSKLETTQEDYVAPAGSVCYRFKERTEMETTGGEKLYGKYDKPTGWIYPKGKVLTQEQVGVMMGAKSILYSNLVSNGIQHCIQVPCGQTYFFYDTDKCLEG